MPVAVYAQYRRISAQLILNPSIHLSYMSAVASAHAAPHTVAGTSGKSFVYMFLFEQTESE